MSEIYMWLSKILTFDEKDLYMVVQNFNVWWERFIYDCVKNLIFGGKDLYMVVYKNLIFDEKDLYMVDQKLNIECEIFIYGC